MVNNNNNNNSRRSKQPTAHLQEPTLWQGHLSLKHPFAVLSWSLSLSPGMHHLTGEGQSIIRERASWHRPVHSCLPHHVSHGSLLESAWPLLTLTSDALALEKLGTSKDLGIKVHLGYSLMPLPSQSCHFRQLPSPPWSGRQR